MEGRARKMTDARSPVSAPSFAYALPSASVVSLHTPSAMKMFTMRGWGGAVGEPLTKYGLRSENGIRV